MSALIASCTMCIDPPCAYFDEGENTETCLCGHTRSQHQASRIFGARGGYPQRACIQFRTIDGGAVTNFHQICQCGGHYSAHHRLEPSLGMIARAPHAPVPLAAPATMAATQSVGFQNITSQVMAMPPITQYQRPTFGASTMSGIPTSFGVPITAPRSAGASGSSRQPTSRQRINNVNGSQISTRKQKLSLTVTLVVLPRDLNPNITSQDAHGLDNYSCLPNGERLSQDLAFLESKGMTHTFTMHDIASTDINLLDQVVSAFDNLLSKNRFTFPDYETMFTLPHGEPSRDQRIMFESLKFNVIRISNNTLNGNKLLLDPSTTYRTFTHRALKARFSRNSNTHPTDSNQGGLLIICPKNGGQLIGPIDNTNQHHHCFTDYILAGLGKLGYSQNLPLNQGRTEEELEDEWRTAYSYQCRTTCPRPRTRLFLPENGESDNNTWDIIDAILTQPLTTQRERSSGPRRSNRIASASNSTPASTSTSLSPLVEMLEVTGPAPFPLDMPSPTPQHRVPLPSPSSVPATIASLPTLPQSTNNRLTIAIPPYVLPAGREPDFSTFEEFENHVNATRCPDILSAEDLFSVEGDSVPDAATGLVAALMNVYPANDAPLRAQHLQIAPDSRVLFTGLIRPNDATLERIFSFQHWMFRGGRRGSDSVGTGVMCNVLSEAIKIASEGILEDLDNDDGYMTLRISADGMVSDRTIDRCFALGALCTIFMIKAHSAPEPISPALIQAAIGTLSSIQERGWLHSISPPIASVLDLLPKSTNYRHPIPDHPSLRSLVRSKFPGTSFDAVLNTPQDEAQRVKFNRQFFVKVLLGTSEATLANASEFRAFSQGINLYLTPTIPSFKEVIASSSKYLLAQCYSRRITSAEQLIPHLVFQHHRSNTPEQVADVAYLVPQIRKAVERYLRGTGHPLRALEFCDPDVYHHENADPSLRARRFVKVLSGLEMMPVEDHSFKVSIYEDIKEAALFGGEYDQTKDLIPPSTHTCLFEIDIWANSALINALATAEAPLGEDTEFDWSMHMGVMQLGHDNFLG